MESNNTARIRDIARDMVRGIRTTPHFNDWAAAGVTFSHRDMAQNLPIEEEEIDDAINAENRRQIRIGVFQASNITYFRAPPRKERDQSHNRPRHQRR